jgi:predicted esterase
MSKLPQSGRLVSLLVSTLAAGCNGTLSAPGDAGSAALTDARRTEDAIVFDAPGADVGEPALDAGLAADDATAPPDAALSDAASSDTGPVGPSSTRQTERPLGTTAAGNGFHEYLPPGYGDGALRPLLVFWHGIGENGNGTSELVNVTRAGPPRLIRDDEWPADRPFVVLSPQHAGGGCPSASEIHDFIAFAMDTYDVDPARVYLTGLSCGAIGSWNYLGEHLDSQIVAMVAIAGDGRGAWSRSMCELGRVSIWAFHGDADDVVAPAGTIEPTTALAACPSPPRRDLEVTIYPGVGHNSWTRTYDLSAGHDIYAWLLAHHR